MIKVLAGKVRPARRPPHAKRSQGREATIEAPSSKTLLLLLHWILGVLSSAGGLTLLVFILRDFLKQWLTSSVQYSFDKKLEKLKANSDSELKRLEKSLETQQHLTSSAFLEARRASNDRRLDAIQSLWDLIIQIHFDAPRELLSNVVDRPVMIRRLP
jgi:hypothetical protein